ncbi:S-adenosyl-L-methionine-dependent methyltransferase [Serendipita vermifera]|nr:S-adenosyl-L-methionine-dependent methyltransferase [Serendipita vermifera]
MEGLYPPVCEDQVQKVLKSSPRDPRRILDLGSGTGVWCIEMALKFPHVEVLGIDLKPTSKEGLPPNCSFLVHDINTGLSKFHGLYDLVHCRQSGWGFIDHHASLMESIKCLKPGGMIMFIDPLHMLKEGRTAFYDPASSTNPEGSWHQRMMMLSFHGAQMLGNDIKGGEMDLERGFWDLEECNPNTCGAVEMACPIGDWATSNDPKEAARLKQIGELWYKNIHRIHWHLDKPLKASGRSDKDIEVLRKKNDEEFRDFKHRMAIRIRVVWGQTKSGPNTEPNEALTIGEQFKTSSEENGYQLMNVFLDKDEWRSRNAAVRTARTTDMVGLLTTPGYDLIEEL